MDFSELKQGNAAESCGKVNNLRIQ